MKKRTKIISFFISAIFIFYGSLWLWFLFVYESEIHEKPDFDLFIAENFLSDYDTISTYPYPPAKELPHAIWKKDPVKKLPIEWVFKNENFENLDSLNLGIKNISGSKIYYMSWGAPNSRLRNDFYIYKNGKIDSILFTGFGCGTGIYLEPLNNKALAKGAIWNPLCYYPGSGAFLNTDTDTFPSYFRKIYGDSVKIKFMQATYSLPWTKFESQMISSPLITISTEKVLQKWKKNRSS